MPNPLPPHITTFKEAVKWFLEQSDYAPPKVKVLAELYQATSDLFPSKDEFSGTIDVSGGVCQGMALTWIKKNNASGGADAFRKESATNWDTFANAQITIKHRKLCLKPQLEELTSKTKAFDEERLKWKAEVAYGKETGMMASIKHSVVAPKTTVEIDTAIQGLSKTSKELKAMKTQLEKDAGDMYASMVFATDSQAQRFEEMSQGLSLSRVVPEIRGDAGMHPTYYMINMTESSGHCIAVHAAYRPRLLDANGCEFQFDSMNTLYAFLQDYWQIYKRAGYASARVEIYRFGVRLTKSQMVSEFDERWKRGNVMDQLPKV
ncbi:MAG TPA: hypothetical protein VN776_00980 [Terracidiphilus sp.]|nr:hypothetical protein [Terracidiphilus sp.]